MGGKHFPTAHKRTKPADSRTPVATALPCDPHAQRSAYARYFQGFPGMNRLRKGPAYAGVRRLLYVGWTREPTFPPEPPLPLHPGTSKATEEKNKRKGGSAGDVGNFRPAARSAVSHLVTRPDGSPEAVHGRESCSDRPQADEANGLRNACGDGCASRPPRAAFRLCPALPRISGHGPLPERPEYAGVHRLLDVGSAKGSIFPPEAPLLLPCADTTRLVEQERPRAVPETFKAGPDCGL
jgi:hypothetical protein